MPASRVLLGLAAPLVGAGAAWLVALAAGESYPFSEYEAVVLGAWLVMALGAWIKARFGAGLRARVAVIGPREFAADFVAELEAANVRTYDVVGWISPSGPAEYRRLRWLGTLDEVRESVIAENIDLLVCGPGAGDAEGARIEDICARVADDCLDLPVRLIAANQLYEEIFGHVPVGMIDAAWYRYIMHPRFRASGPHSKRIFDLVLGTVIALVFLPVLAVAAIAIKLSDRGPVFYRQRRLGEFGEEFEILKLRTMRTDAEANGPQWAAVADDRVTSVGRDPAAHARRRDPAALERAARRHDPRRAAPRASRDGRRARAALPALHAASSGQARDRRVGGAALRLRRLRHRHRLEAVPRPLLHQAPLDAGRRADPRRDRGRGLPRRPPRAAGPGRAVPARRGPTNG